LLLLLVLVGCSTIDREASTPTPTWFFTGPTTAPTRRPLDARPTDSAFQFGQGIGQNNLTAAALPADSEMPPIVVEQITPGVSIVQISLSDGGLVFGALYENPPLEIEGRRIPARLPGVLLIGASVDAWGGFPEQLGSRGYTVLVVDLGNNTFLEDFQDIFGAFIGTGTVNPAQMSVIGAGMGADLALIGCAAESGCDAVVLLSPQEEGTLLNVLASYNPRAVFAAASSTDRPAYDVAQAVYNASTSAESEVALLINVGSGAAMLQNAEALADDLITWLDAIMAAQPFD